MGVQKSVGIREFRQELASYIDRADPVTITRHGQTVGLFVPIHRDRQADLDAFAEAAKKANALLTELGISEDEIADEFTTLRQAGGKALSA